MNTPTTRATRWASQALLICCASHAAVAAAVDATAAAAGKTAAQVCEAAVTQAIHKGRGKTVQEVQFTQAKHAVTPEAASDNSSIHGEGRYRGTGGNVPFTYSCTFDPQTHVTTGVIFKETGEAARTVEKPWQADLTHLSPEVCEAAVAGAIKEKNPRAANVVLSSTSRQLKPAPNAHTYMWGQGSVERAAGMSPSAFTYRCEMDTASGKFIDVQTDWVE